MRRYSEGGASENEGSSAAARPAPGKVARTDGLGARRRVGDVAAQGVAEGGERLPFLDVIQASFGAGHDLSGIEAHLGGAAGDAAAEIGADAYATGNHVAFQDAPDLFTAAHEAAHVVQQQAGVQLLGGVGEEGDAYEQHADAVAERVVRGESAADLLAAHAGGGGGAPAVQRSSVRAAAIDKMKKIKDELVAKGHLEKGAPTVASNENGGNGLYTKFTGYTDLTLQENWHGAEWYAQFTAIPEDKRTEYQKGFIRRWELGAENGGISHSPTLTGCNAFTGKFARELHLGDDLGVFTLAQDHGGTFVRAEVGRYPKEGDIIKMKEIPLASGKGNRLHVCVSYNAPHAEGDSWEVLEGGQGGKGVGADKFHFTSKPYSTADVEGWVDIDKQVDESVRKDLAGTWEVELNGETWIYTFPTAGNEVHYEGLTQPDYHGSGTWELAGSNVVFHWPGGTPESWKVADVKKGSNGTKLRKFKNSNAMLSYLTNKKFNVTLGADTWRYEFSAPNRVHWHNLKNPDERGGGTWLSPTGNRHVAIHWDGGTEEHWRDVPTGMKDFPGTQSKGGKTQDCTVHPTW